MADNDTTENTDITAPREPTHEATTPPDNPDVEQDQVDRGVEKIDKAGAGH